MNDIHSFEFSEIIQVKKQLKFLADIQHPHFFQAHFRLLIDNRKQFFHSIGEDKSCK